MKITLWDEKGILKVMRIGQRSNRTGHVAAARRDCKSEERREAHGKPQSARRCDPVREIHPDDIEYPAERNTGFGIPAPGRRHAAEPCLCSGCMEDQFDVVAVQEREIEEEKGRTPEIVLHVEHDILIPDKFLDRSSPQHTEGREAARSRIEGI